MRSIVFSLLTAAAILSTSAAVQARGDQTDSKSRDLRGKSNSELLSMQRKDLAEAMRAKDGALKTVKEESEKAKAYQRWAENEAAYRQKMAPLINKAWWRKFWLAITAPCLLWVLFYVWACDNWRSAKSPGWLATAVGGLLFILILLFA